MSFSVPQISKSELKGQVLNPHTDQPLSAL